MTLSAMDALNVWKTTFATGATEALDQMLAEDFSFENTAGEKEDKASVLAWAKEGGFKVNEFLVYHEDDHVICGRHTYEVEGEPTALIMFFARYENGKCKFWKVHGGAAAVR